MVGHPLPHHMKYVLFVFCKYKYFLSASHIGLYHDINPATEPATWHSAQTTRHLHKTLLGGKMPTFKLSHLEARDFICCCCRIKLKSRKKIMPSEETKVKLYCKPDYDSALREQPTGLCSSCRLDLFASARRVQWGGRNPNPREKWDAYELEHGRFKEKEHQPDSCQICLLAHHNPVGEKMRGGEWRRMLQSREPVPPEKKKKRFCTNCYQ